MSHLDDNEQEKPIAYASRTLSDAEKQFLTSESEMSLANSSPLFQALYIWLKVTIYTDHEPLAQLKASTEPEGI